MRDEDFFLKRLDVDFFRELTLALRVEAEDRVTPLGKDDERGECDALEEVFRGALVETAIVLDGWGITRDPPPLIDL